VRNNDAAAFDTCSVSATAMNERSCSRVKLGFLTTTY
jgi:hypothetical protein